MTQVVDEQEPGLRERKKRATRRALQRAALMLVAERGMDDVTVDEIAAVADVSARTFFNYFGSKEDALSTTDPEVLQEILAAIEARPREESALQTLRAVHLQRANQIAGDTEFWRLRAQVIKHYPELGARLVGASLAADHQVAVVLAKRMGVDPHSDPRPMLIAGAATVAKRTAMGLWLAGKQNRDFVEVYAECFDGLASLAHPADAA